MGAAHLAAITPVSLIALLSVEMELRKTASLVMTEIRLIRAMGAASIVNEMMSVVTERFNLSLRYVTTDTQTPAVPATKHVPEWGALLSVVMVSIVLSWKPVMMGF